jgi:hypothetical protein
MAGMGQLLPLRGGWRTGSYAPNPAVRLTITSRLKSTQTGQHTGWRLEAR